MKSTPFLLLGLALVAFSGNATAVERKFSNAKIQTFTKLFNEANTDPKNPGYLTFEEFSNSYGASPRPVITQIRFDELASTINVATVRGGVVLPPTVRGILLEDFIAANGGRAIKPTKEEIFWAADDDNSGGIDFEEFADTRVTEASTPASIFKAFDKIDKGVGPDHVGADDGIISPAEWGIEVKAVLAD